MSQQSNAPIKNQNEIQIRLVDTSTVCAELQLRIDEINAVVRRLEEAKSVSQETMQLEVSI